MPKSLHSQELSKSNITRKWLSLIPHSDTKAIIIVFVLVLLSFANSLNNDFAYDDKPYIRDNKYITSLRYIGLNFTRPFPPHLPELNLYRPIVSLSFMIDRSLGLHESKFAEFGFPADVSTIPFHVTNIIIHFLVCGLIYLLLRKLWPNSYVPFLATALFATHPAHVEVVASIVGRAESLCALFYLLAIYFFLNRKTVDHYYSKATLLSLFFFFLALLTKEMAITLPAVLILIEELRRIRYSTSKPPSKIIGRHLLTLLPYLAVLLLYITIRMQVVGEIGIQRSHTYFFKRKELHPLASMLIVFLVYLKVLLFPLHLNADYNFPILLFGGYTIEGPTSLLFFWPLLGLGMLVLWLILALFAYVKKSPVFLPLLWFLITLFPVSNIIPFGDLMAERFLYLPSIGFCLLGALFFNYLLRRISTPSAGLQLMPRIALIAFYLIIVIFTVRSFWRNRDWQDELSVCKSVIKVAPENIDAYHGLAHFFADKHREELKLADAKRAMGKFAEADRHQEKAKVFEDETINYYYLTMEKDPKCFWAYHDFAAFLMEGDTADLLQARELLFQALKLRPVELLDVFFNAIAVTYLKTKDYDKALPYFQKAVRLRPNVVHYLNGLGIAYAGVKNYAAARLQWGKALQIDPTNEHARNNLRKLEAEIKQ